jgi:hypothetical protein
MPRNRSPIGSLARAADCASRLSGLPGRIGGAARGKLSPTHAPRVQRLRLPSARRLERPALAAKSQPKLEAMH